MLLLGNVKFEAKGDAAVVASSSTVTVANAAALLEVDAVVLEKFLLGTEYFISKYEYLICRRERCEV